MKNVQGIAQACRSYMTNSAMHRRSKYGHAMPTITPAPSATNWGSVSGGNPSVLWMLVSYRFLGADSFLCPSAEAFRGFSGPRGSDIRFSTAPRTTLSYSYLSQVKFTDGNTGVANIEVTSSLSAGLRAAELAIIADSNPRFKLGSETSQDGSQSGGNRENSLNHGRAGQNVGFLDGHAIWTDTPTIKGTKPLNSSDNLDNIYRSCGSSSDDSSGKRGAINDAFLIP
jgi:hypothetical protein